MEFKLDELNKETFERICEIQTPANSVISSFGVSKQDIENWCKKTYSKSFAEAYYYFAYNGKVKLIEAMIEVAKKRSWNGKTFNQISAKKRHNAKYFNSISGKRKL